MKKIVILAISAILVANTFAQEQKKECAAFAQEQKKECAAFAQEQKKECNGGKQLSKEERVEFDIKRFTNELMLSDQQAEKFAVTYREYAAKLDELFEKNVASGKCEKDKDQTDAELDKFAKQRFEGLKKLADLQSKFYDKFRKDLSARQVDKVMRIKEPFGPKPCCGKHEFHKGPQQFEKQGPREFEKQGPRKEEFVR